MMIGWSRECHRRRAATASVGEQVVYRWGASTRQWANHRANWLARLLVRWRPFSLWVGSAMTRRPESSHQIPLALGGDSATNVVATTRKANRKAGSRAHAASTLDLPYADDRYDYLPVVNVPRTRAECPADHDRCPHIRCEWNLARLDAENRAGRPGLSHVPRGEGGLTQSVAGDMGAERPGTTLRPLWLHVRGLEIAREVKVYVSRDEDGGIVLHEIRNGTLDYWLDNLRIGEKVLVLGGGSYRVEDGEIRPDLIARARLNDEGALVFDRELPESAFTSSDCVILLRMRGVPWCGLDLIEQHGKMGNEAIGDAIGRHRTLVAREIKQAIKKAVKEGERQGIDGADLVGALMGMGDEK